MTVLRRRRAVIECVHNLRRGVACCADAGVDVSEMQLLLHCACERSYPSSGTVAVARRIYPRHRKARSPAIVGMAAGSRSRQCRDDRALKLKKKVWRKRKRVAR